MVQETNDALLMAYLASMTKGTSAINNVTFAGVKRFVFRV